MKDFDIVDQIVSLIIAEKQRPLSEEEQWFLNEWISEEKTNRLLYESLTDEKNIPDKLMLLSAFNEKTAYNEFVEKTKVRRTRLIIRQYLKYAAILVPLIVASYFFYQQTRSVKPERQLTDLGALPGTSKAILVLDGGSVFNLEEETDIPAASEEINIVNDKNTIGYKISEHKLKLHGRKLQYHTLKTPRGGEYQLSLSDGTKVWLNSESELKYPVIFSRLKREVFLKGEAYFEVAENRDCPFYVNTASISLKVLGTSFNIRAYDDESQTTSTLVTGKVMLRELETQKEFALAPNEQAVTSGYETVIQTVDVNPFIAWMQGRIIFEESTIDEIFNDLSRWYDIEIEYVDEDVRDLRYSIDIIKYANLDEVLNILELTKKIEFEIIDNTLFMMKP